MVQRLHDIVTFIFVVTIILSVLAGLLCLFHILPLIYECIRSRSKVKPTHNQSEKEIKKINMNPLQIEIV